MPVNRTPPENIPPFSTSGTANRKRQRSESTLSDEGQERKKSKQETNKDHASLYKKMIHKYPQCKGWPWHKIRAYVKQVDPELVRSHMKQLLSAGITGSQAEVGNRAIDHQINEKQAEKLLLSQQAFDHAHTLRKQQDKLAIEQAEKGATKKWQEAHEIDASKQQTFSIAGTGSFGVVEHSVSSESGPMVIKKTSKKATSSENKSYAMEQESSILNTVHHPNIIKVITPSTHDKDNHELYMQEGGAPLSLLVEGSRDINFNLESISQVSTPDNKKNEPEAPGYLDIIWRNVSDLFSTPIKETSKTFGGPLPPALIQHISSQILDALAYLHENGIIHKDIKADNILIKPDGTVKIIDFGMASHRQEQHIFSGTPSYMAPEAINKACRFDPGFSNIVTEKIDVYAAACVICLLTTGENYNVAHSVRPKEYFKQFYDNAVNKRQELQAKIKANVEARYPEEQFTQKNSDLIDLMGKMLEPNPDKRISAKEALNHPFFKR